MNNIALYTWQRGNLESNGWFLWDSKQELSHPGERKIHVCCLGVKSPLVSCMPDSYKRYVEKYRLISAGTISQKVLDLWVGRPTENMSSNFLFDSGIFDTASLKFIQCAMSPFWRGETLAGQLQLLNIGSCEQPRAFPEAALMFHNIHAHLLCSY